MQNNKDPYTCCKRKSNNIYSSNYLNIEGNKFSKDGLFVCPMHPEIRQNTLGDCSICGMPLESEIASLEDDQDLMNSKNRLYIACIFSIPLAILTMSSHFFPKLISFIPSNLFNLIQFVLSTPVVLIAGFPLLTRFINSIKQRNLNMYSLLGLGITTAYLYSIFVMIYSNSKITSGDYHNILYFESAAIITTLVLLGELLELTARHKTKNNMRSLLALAPLSARIVNKEGIERKINVSEVLEHDLVRVMAGEQIPIDGIIIEGQASIDQSMLTGESLPVLKNIGDKVIGGTLNIAGTFILRVTDTANNTMLAKIINIVMEAQRTKAPIQRIADLVAKYFVIIVIIIAILTFISWYMLASVEHNLSMAIINAVTVLVVACPCALGLATPMSIMVATNKATKLGILIKNAISLEKLSKINNILIDKTKTITEGKPVINQIIKNNTLFSENEILQLVASLEKNSEHPLALALIEEAVKRTILLLPVKDFQSILGQGIKGIVANNHVAIGNDKFINTPVKNKILQDIAEQIQTKGEIVLFVEINNQQVALVTIVDPIKLNTAVAIEKLKKHNIKIIMLTGDHLLTAKYVANQVKIDHIISDAMPLDKIKVVKNLQQAKHMVAMIGDGINDAPALSQADLSIAMGNGTDIAINSADIILVNNDLLNIVRAYNLSKKTILNIKQNLTLAFGYNIVAVAVATGMLYPFSGILLNPMIASVMMVLSSFLVIINALRIDNMSLNELEK